MVDYKEVENKIKSYWFLNAEDYGRMMAFMIFETPIAFQRFYTGFVEEVATRQGNPNPKANPPKD